MSTPGGNEKSEDQKDDGSPSNEPHESRERPLILLVEDNSISARSLRDYLDFKGYSVEWAEDAALGIDLAGRHLPRLILMDIQMAGMDGMGAVRRLRLLPGLREVPIVALTALAMPGDRERFLEGGGNSVRQ